MASVTHQRKFKVPGYQLRSANIGGETKALEAARKAISAGARMYEDKKTGELYVLCKGKVVHWEKADPSSIGKG